MNTDRIEKKVLLHALRKRVWRALSDSKEFGYWFGVTIDGPFTPGASIHGVISGTAVDAEVAAAQRTHQGKPFDIIIEQMEPEKTFSFAGIPTRLTRASTTPPSQQRWWSLPWKK
jgi:hypothetical protein